MPDRQRPTPRTTLSLLSLLAMLYFAQGLPAGLLGKALPALARDAGMDVRWIGLLALAALPWALKFLWAPWVDRWGSGQRNHRKRWMLACIVGVIAVLLCTSLLDRELLFGRAFVLLMVLLFLLNLFSATQDIATDGLATRLLSARLRGPGNSIQVGGYKLGLIIGSGVLLILVDSIGWRYSLWLIVAMMLLLLAMVCLFHEPAEQPAPREPVSPRWWWRQLSAFWQQSAMGLWLLILLFYKVGDGFGSRMIKPFLVDMELSLAAVGRLDIVSSVVGLLGVALAGLLMLRLSRKGALLGFAMLHALSFLGWAWLAMNPDPFWVWPVALFEQFADGLATVALFVVMMDYCRDGHEGSDYTMQASVQLFAVGLFTLSSGFSVAALGYAAHFSLAAFLCAIVIMAALFWRPPVRRP